MTPATLWITRANALTGFRLLLAPPLCVALWNGASEAALAIFVLAVGTDFADGWVARRYHEATPLGRFIDHGVDATFVVAGTATLACLGRLPVLLPGLIALAFLQYAIDSNAHRGAPLRPSWLGRWNGIAYYAVVAVVPIRETFDLTWPNDALLQGFGWLLVVSTGLSMLDRLRILVAARGS